MVIQCSNPTCRAMATLPVGRCQVCQTPLPYRFLLAVGDPGLELPPYTVVAGRYQVWQHPIWLDTQPDAVIKSLEVIPPSLLPYLRLSDLAQFIPRPYYYLTPEDGSLTSPVLLLDAAPIGLSLTEADHIQAHLLPTLNQAWGAGTAIQQLNWLRQVALLWSALSQEQVAATLLAPAQLRVDQSLLRITTLVADQASPVPVTLVSLGQQWHALAQAAQPSVRGYLTWLATALMQGTVSTSAELMAELEQAIQTLAQGLSVTVDWVADTDQGPSRDRNEDACYPQGQAQQQVLIGQGGEAQTLPLLLVCDGIGGHEQGNVASQTAIKLLLEELQPLAQQPDLSPTVVAQRLKQAITLANNAISSRNNDEQRSARARMGTTVVVALVHFPYVSIAHLGDSRAYRVSLQTGYQITLDDDVASREAHLGYALYQEAVHMPGGGALVQALGINDSGYLYPTVQHLCIDDPCVLLLCSDGLSDYDRVDALWPYTARSLVGNATALAPVAQQLIQQANRLNGHDNVTVGLMRFLAQTTSLPTLPAQQLRPQSNTATPALVAPTEVASVPVGTTPLAQPVARRSWGRWLGGTAAALLVLGGAGWTYWSRQPQPVALTPVLDTWPAADLAGQSLLPLGLALTVDIAVGSFWQVSATPFTAPGLRLAPSPTLAANADVTPSSATEAPAIPAGSILKVVSRQTLADQTDWVRLQVCSIPSGRSLAEVPTESDPTLVESSAALAQQLTQPGDEGWIRHYHLYGAATNLDTITPTQAGGC